MYETCSIMCIVSEIESICSACCCYEKKGGTTKIASFLWTLILMDTASAG